MGKENLILLSSVGSLMNTLTGMIYPSPINLDLDDYKEDVTTGTHVQDCDVEWFENLDDDDLLVVADYYETKCKWNLDMWIGGLFPESDFKKGRI